MVAAVLGLIFVFTPLLFPTGRLPSPHWRPVAVTGALAVTAVAVLGAVQPTLKLQTEEVDLPNPVGLAGAPDPEGGALGAVLLGVLAACMVASVVSVVLRFRRSSGVERQQLKWFTYSAALMLVANVVTFTLLPEGVASDVLFGLSIALVPIAAGVAGPWPGPPWPWPPSSGRERPLPGASPDRSCTCRTLRR
ncbi:MAG: hypothetical protein ABWZ62_05580 [Actinomycetota bacterium]